MISVTTMYMIAYLKYELNSDPNNDEQIC